MKVGAIVQARMTSNRLPGKVLRAIAGKPLLQYVLERLECCDRIGAVVVATSRDKSDDALAAFCQEQGVKCFRGDLEDVAGRFIGTLDEHGWKRFVRVSGDSPLLDQRLVDRAVEIFYAGEYDLVTNVWPRSYPYGQSVEVIKSDSLRLAYERMVKREEKEHVTRFFYEHEQEFKISNFGAKVNYAGLHMSVDTKDDFRVVEALIKHMDRPHWEYTVDELVKLWQVVQV